MLFYFNYLQTGPNGSGPTKFKSELHLSSRNDNSKQVIKLVNEVALEAGLNIRVLHLEGETIFGSTKQKLDILPRKDSNSHCHDCMNYSIHRLGKRASSS